MKMKKIILRAAVLGLWLPALANAQLDPELDKPYRLQVVLQVADNRFLTPVFQEQLQRGLRDQLQLMLGALARVEVSRTHPLLRDIEAKGLEGGLDGYEQISGLKTHFVLVDFAAGVYSLRARQYDGMTGLVSPVVRQARTSERSLVAQTAARLVEQDFGLVGTVIEVIEAGKVVKLALKGGKLAERLDHWVKPGEVFAISQISKENDQLRGRRIPWALLEVQDTSPDGQCRCRLWHRFQQDDLRSVPGVLGYRCLKLATTPGPVKVRLIDDEQFRPLDGVAVQVLRPGDSKGAELTTNRDGLLVTRDNYQHMALVQVLAGGVLRQFPVELTGERTVECRLKVQADADANAPVLFRREQWLRRVLDDLRLAAERVADLNRELNQSLAGALEAARVGLKNMEAEVNDLSAEHDEILRLAGDKIKLDLRDGELAFAGLRKRKDELQGFVKRIEEVLAESKGEAHMGLAKLVERARLLEGEADFDQAIALYEKVLQASPDQPKLKEKLTKLKADWTPKNPKHAEARRYLVQEWPRLTVADLKKNFEPAHAALTVCSEAHDRLTPLKVIHANVIHAANLKKQLDTLNRQEGPDARAQAKVLEQTIRDFRSLHAEATKLTEPK